MDKVQSNVIVDLDDFCEDFVTEETWRIFDELIFVYPKFKVTAFAIPALCDDGWLSDIAKRHKWMQFAVHGSDHKDMTEWDISDAKEIHEAVNQVLEIAVEHPWQVGFKAPKWKLSERLYNDFRRHKIWTATNQSTPFARPTDVLNYRYDVGDCLVKDMHYEVNNWFKWHGHIQSCYNGLADRLFMMMSAWPVDSEFHFISEVINGAYQKVVGV